MNNWRGWSHKPIRPTCLVVLASLFLAGCPDEPARPGSYAFGHLEGKLLYDDPLLVVPNRAWRRHQENHLWFFGHSAALVCHVNEKPTLPLLLTLLPHMDGESPGEEAGADAPEFFWNGRDVADRLRTLPTGEIEVAIPPAWLSPGTHFLSLKNGAASPVGEEGRFLFFRSLGYRIGDVAHTLELRHFLTYRYLSNLLTFGLTGSFDPEMLGGFVFSGERSIEIDLESESGGLFQARIQNSGAGRALFRVLREDDRHETDLDPHEREHLALEIPPGVRKLELEVEGDANGLFLWGAPHFQPNDADTSPPVVLITLDTTRRDALGVYREGESSTPHLDAFATRATVYDHAYTTAPWTLPAHASIMTGLYPFRHGAGVTGDHLEISFETLAEILRQRGYLTAGFAGGILSSSHFGVGQGFALYRDTEGFETTASELTDEALEFLAQTHSSERPPKRQPPFFLFVNYFDPHFPYRAPPEIRAALEVPARRRAVGDDEIWQRVLDGSSAAWEQVVDGHSPASRPALAALAAVYRAEVAFMDQELGRLLDGLRALDRFDEALILITADHGELLGENGRFSHSGRLDSELLRVPLLIKRPGQRRGHREARLVSLVDLFPTVLEIATGEPAGRPVDGLSLLGDGPLFQKRGFIVAEEHDRDFHRLPRAMRIADDLFAVFGDEEHRLYWPGGQECYRRTRDRWQPRKCEDSHLARAVTEIWRVFESQGYRPAVDRIGLSRQEREKLRALGYLR